MPNIFSADRYSQALGFAAKAHAGQLVPGTHLPYLVHLTTVASEVLAAAMNAPEDRFDVDFALTCALLHDTLEDTSTPEEALASAFGPKVLHGVRALSKDSQLPKESQMADSLARILTQPREVAMVKLADRISNLQAPPAYWSLDKRATYQKEARRILEALAPASAILGQRLAEKIEAYAAYIEAGTSAS